MSSLVVRHLSFVLCFMALFSCTEEKIGPSSGAFLKYYGGNGIDEVNVVEQTSSGEYMVLGSSQNSTLSVAKQMVILRVNSYGMKIGENHFGDNHTTEGRALKETKDGDFILIGDYINEDGTSDLYIVKVNPNLEKKWETVIPIPSSNEKGNALTILPDGNYFVLGTSTDAGGTIEMITAIVTPEGAYHTVTKPGFGANNNNVGKSVVLRPNGRLAWCWTQNRDFEGNAPGTSNIGLIFATEDGISDAGEFNFGRERNDYASDIQKATTGYILLGTSQSVSGSTRIYLVRTYEDGRLQWDKVINSNSENSGNQRGSSVYPTSDGGYIILGTTDVSVYTHQDGQNLFLVKANSTGEVEWEEIYGGNGNEEAATVRQTADGGYVIAATVELNGDPTICLIKTNSKGKLIN